MRLIDADALVENSQVYEIECGDEIGDDVRKIKAILASRVENAPTIDLLKHGHWIEARPIVFRAQYAAKSAYCSECNAWKYLVASEMPNYCENCGARMDGEV